MRRAKQDTCSCKQCENLGAPLSGGAALEEAAAWEAKQMEAARHAKDWLLAEVERLSAARAKGKKGKKKKKNLGVGDAGAARLNEEIGCAVRELVDRSELDFDDNLMRHISILSKNGQKIGACGGPASGARRRLRRATGATAPDPVYT